MKSAIFTLISAILLHQAEYTGSSLAIKDEPVAVCTQAAYLDSLPFLCVATDAVRQIYTVNAVGEIEKYTPDGRKIGRFTRTRLGMPAMIDPSNPMKTLVWYPDFGAILFLDRNLTETGGELQLNTAGWPEVRVVAQASDGNIWLYDQAYFKLRKISPDGRSLMESRDFNLLFSQAVQVACIRDDGNRVFVSSPEIGLLIFDVYGQWETIIPEKGIAQFVLDHSEFGSSLRYANPEGQVVRLNLTPPYAKENISPPAMSGFVPTMGGWVIFETGKPVFYPYP